MVNVFTFFIQPIVVLLFWLTYDENNVLNNYGISYNTVVLYFLSAIVVFIFSIINIIMIFHVLECYLDLDFQEPIRALLERYEHRTVFWKVDDEDINTSLDTKLRGADHYCLSSQFFFLLTIYVGSMIIVIIGITIMINSSYNCFKDIAVLPIVLFWYIIINILTTLIKYLAIKLNVWGYQDYLNADSQVKKKKFKIDDEIIN